MRTLVIPAILLLLSATATTVCADACADYTGPAHFVDRISVSQVGTDGTDLRVIDISWPYAYAGGFGQGYSGPYFHVIDLAGVDGPVAMGYLAEFGAVAFDLEVHGNLVYAAQDGLRIIDVSDPAAPLVTGLVDLPGYARSVTVVEGVGLAFAACNDSGLVAIDVSDPTNPAVVGTLVPGSGISIYEVAVAYPYAFLALNGSDGFEVVDVSDPSAMVAVASLPLRLYGVATAGDHAYGVINNGTGTDDGLRVIDVTDPLAPLVVGVASGWDLRTVEVHGDLAYADAHIFDVSDPANPTHVRHTNLTVASPATSPLAVHDGTIYTAAGGRLSSKGYGIEIGEDDGGGALVPPVGELSDYLVYAMRFRGDLGYVFGHRLVVSNYAPVLSLYDVTDPAAPVLLGTEVLGDAHQRSTVDGNGVHAFVAQNYEITAVDVSAAPVLDIAGTLPLNYRPMGSWLDGNHLYLTDAEYPDRGLRVYDVSDPAAMVEIGFLDLAAYEDEVYEVVVRGAYAYVPRGYSTVTGLAGLDIVDISDPTLPSLAATVPFPEQARDVALTGDHAWVTYGWTHSEDALRMATVDVSDPLAPVIVDDIGVPLSTSDITISGSHLYAVSQFRGPAVFDISNPLDTRAIASIDADFSYGFRIATAGDHVYAGSWLGSGSVRIYPPQCTAVAGTGLVPAAAAFDLRAYPNPFNPTVTLSFDLGAPQRIKVTVFDVAGRRVASLLDEPTAAGPTSVLWRGIDDAGRSVGSGVYFARVEGERSRQMIKVTLLK